jgi:hypothetical protein
VFGSAALVRCRYATGWLLATAAVIDAAGQSIQAGSSLRVNQCGCLLLPIPIHVGSCVDVFLYSDHPLGRLRKELVTVAHGPQACVVATGCFHVAEAIGCGPGPLRQQLCHWRQSAQPRCAQAKSRLHWAGSCCSQLIRTTVATTVLPLVFRARCSALLEPLHIQWKSVLVYHTDVDYWCTGHPPRVISSEP